MSDVAPTVRNAVIAGGMAAFIVPWLTPFIWPESPGIAGAVAFVIVFSLFQLFRYRNESAVADAMAANDALMKADKPRPIAAPLVGDGYRMASPLGSPELPELNKYLDELPKRRNRARIWAAIVAVSWLLLPRGESDWKTGFTIRAVILGFTLLTWGAGSLILKWAQKRQSKTDYFLQHLENDTKRILENQTPKLRVGVDFGAPVPPAETLEEAVDSEAPYEEKLANRAQR